MRTFAVLLVTAVLMAAQSRVRAEVQPMSFVGKTIVISYDSGLRIQAHYRSDTELTWRALTGPEQGQEGTEEIHAAEVAPDVFFISWLESSGVSVSNVLDFQSKVVFAFVTFDAGGFRQAAFDKGTLQERPANEGTVAGD